MVLHGSGLLVITEKPHDWADDAMEFMRRRR
jgi:hypothetical protein